MRKIFTFVLALTASVGIMFAEEVKIGDLYYDLGYGEASVLPLPNDEHYTGDIVIPATVEDNSITYDVISIGSSAFEGCTGLTSVEIPNSVTTIWYYAFQGCTGLTSVTIPGSVTKILNQAFYNCSNLTSITSKATTPPTCGNFVFSGVPKTIPVYVPKESVAAYKAKDGWKDFGENIQAFPPQTKEMTPSYGVLSWDETDQQWGIMVYEYDALMAPKFYFCFVVDGEKNIMPTTMTLTNSTEDSYVFADAVNPEDFSGVIKNANLTITLDGTGCKYDNVGGVYYVNAKIKGELSDADGNKLIIKEPANFIKLDIPYHIGIATGMDQISKDKSQMTNKIIKDNQILILRGDRIYTITGQEVK